MYWFHLIYLYIYINIHTKNIYIYIYTINLPYDHAWDIWDVIFGMVLPIAIWIRLQKLVFRIVDHPLAASLEALGQQQNVDSLSFFESYYKYYFVRSSSKLAGRVPLSYPCEESTPYSQSLLDFSVTFSRLYKDFYVTVSYSYSQTVELVACWVLSFDLHNKWVYIYSWWNPALFWLCSFSIFFYTLSCFSCNSMPGSGLNLSLKRIHNSIFCSYFSLNLHYALFLFAFIESADSNSLALWELISVA